jgi:methylenetetrahydrofolate reductase (NADPH)
MRIVDLLKANKKPSFAFEFFPAKTPKADENLHATIDRLAELSPDFVTVTFGAGGSTREGSRQLADHLKKDKRLEVVAYFAGYGLGRREIDGVLEDYRQAGVENVLVVRGDPPRDPSFRPQPDSLTYASDLLAYIRPKYSFCLGAAGYPEGHVRAESPDRDADFLKRKVDGGAEYILTNYFYDNRCFFDYLERCRARSVTVPILPGVMPIFSLKMAENLAATCGATIPARVRQALAEIPETDKAAAAQYGIDLALEQCRGLLAAGVPGILFYTMNRWESIAAIVRGLRAESLL